MVQAIIVGGGLIGLTTARELQRRGIDTLVLEKREDVALETSYANGALLTPSMPDPWNGPGATTAMLRSLMGFNSPLKLRMSALPRILPWGMQFLMNSTPSRHWDAIVANYILANYSLTKTLELTDTFSDYNLNDRGTLKIFRDRKSADHAASIARMLAGRGLKNDVMSADEAVRLEPLLRPVQNEIVAAIHYPNDRSGDAYRFCNLLKDQFLREGGQIVFGSSVDTIAVKDGRAIGVRVDGLVHQADFVVIAAAAATPKLLSDVGLKIPVYPVKGYTLTFDISKQGTPSIPIVDDGLHAAIVPIDGKLRIAGTAEFCGFDPVIRPERIANLFQLLNHIYPEIARTLRCEEGRAWAGHRPVSADGRPFVGGTSIARLFVNAGHGHLGWTCAAGSAHLLADIATGATPDIDPSPYQVERVPSSHLPM